MDENGQTGPLEDAALQSDMDVTAALNSPRSLRNPVMLLAFEGWNDAAESATDAIDHLAEIWNAKTIREVEAEEFFDFQVTRPHLSTDAQGTREIIWPSTSISVALMPRANYDIVLVRGVEPNLKWGTFSREILKAAQDLHVTMAIGIGALLSDNAHTRPFPIYATTMSLDFPPLLNFAPSEYEGPTGILGVVLESLASNGIPAGSLWVQVPHYVAAAPCPKATLALLSRLEEVLDIPVELADLTEAAAEWETDIDAMTEDDEELSGYVKSLEEGNDDNSDEPSESIADEFERYLRRRNPN
jgi:proteasome assembly chaperone (PAC2) family protein